MSPESALEDGKLEVRYYHAGKWQSAGEIFLNKEISNATNGSYFTAKLDGINSWNDLSDLAVVIEYVRGDDSVASQVYLDSLWVDTSYRDPIQDVLSGNVSDVTDAPDNVSFELPQGSASYNMLTTDDGTNINFPYVDTLTDDSLVVRMDKQQYRVTKDRTPNTVFASITNTTQSETKFKVYTSLPGGKGDVLELARYLRDVPVSTSTPIYHDITYYCGDGWQIASSSGFAQASSTRGYACVSEQQAYQCDAITDSGTNCLVKNVHIDDATSTNYVSTWVDAPLSHVVDQDSQVSSVLPPGYSVSASSQDEFDILPGQTVYLKLQIQTPDSTTRKFVLSVKGDGVFGDADSLRLKDEDAWKAQIKFQQAQPQRQHISDQISGKDDFAVDELPSFRFKFKTQRSFFQRVLDFLTRNNVTFRVDKAILIRPGDGEEEHVPVDIGYDPNGEWELQLEKPPRSFKPGKYTVELTMNEAGQTYQDSVDFYWGVLAVNTNKTVYNIGENAHLTMAALDDNGDTLCDAQLDLNITDPDGGTENVPVISGGGCGFNNVTDLPDYVADYSPSISGEYTIELSRLDDNGQVINSTTDSFDVQVDPPISVERIGPTRIYPKSTYQMHFNIRAKDAFDGTVTEILPEGFTVPGVGGGTLERKNGALYLSWNLDLAAGASTSLSYTFKAPDASPYLYILGPATFNEQISGNQVFQEGRTWKMASDALSIATGVAWLSGTTTTNGVEWNTTPSAAIAWTTDDYDTTYFTHSTTTSNTRLTVNVAGDYLVSVTVPTTRTDGSNNVSGLETEIRVNGVKVNQGVGRSTNNRSSQPDASAHLTFLLHNLNVGDYIEAYTAAISTIGTLTVRASNYATLYAEYIPGSETVFSAVGTTTTSGTNLNGTATSSMVWYDVGSRVDSGYSHFNGPSATAAKITLSASGDYMVDVNIPGDDTAAPVANARARARLLLNGVMASSSNFEQDYLPDSNGETAGSMHYFGIVHATTSNTTLSVAVAQDETSAAGTVTVDADQASIYIQKLPPSDVYIGRATTTNAGTNFNPTATSTILWQFDDVKDTADYTHSTSSSPGTITFAKAGDYLLTFNDALTGGSARTSPLISVLLNSGSGNSTGAQVATHFVRNAAGTDSDSSGALTYFLRNVSANDTLTVGTIADNNTGAMTLLQNAFLMLWRKAAQSNWIQDTEAWYQNNGLLTPTTRWPGTSDGDAITSGNAVNNGNALRLRMTLQAQVASATSSDNFKLQYAAGSTCSPALAWTDVGASGSGSIWRFHSNSPAVIDGATTTSVLLAVASTSESYDESNPTPFLLNPVAAGTDGEWDWSIEDNSAPVGTNYCFRMVQSSGSSLKNYNDYPSLITNNSPGAPTLATPFDNEKFASTSPWFTFSSTDDNGDDEDYQIQISSTSTFATTVIDTNSITNTNDFDNVQTPSDRQPFNSSETIRYKVPSVTPLTNGTTYYWRVRAIDDNGTDAYGSWSSTQSFTVDTSVTVSTWFQTQSGQFNEGTLVNVESTSSTDSVGMSAGKTIGTIASPAITYEEHTTGNSWGTVSKTDSYTAPNIIKYQVEYLDSTSTWVVVPDSALSGNSAGTTTNSLNISGLDPATYDTIRVRANFTSPTSTPRLNDWTVSWALSVARPTVSKLFDNEKTSTTTPTFQFTTTDPQGDDLVYQVQWSTDSTFSTVTGSSTSDKQLNGGVFDSVSSSTDASPFQSGTAVQMQISTSSPLINGTTYWIRVRAKDPNGANSFSLWSIPQSFTVDTTVDRSTWFQTTSAQFNTDTLVRTEGVNNTAAVSVDTGKIAIYRAATAGEAQTTAVLNQTFDTTERQDDLYSMQYASSSILLPAGHYAVMYGFRENTTGGTGRTQTQADLSLASTTLPIGWSSAIMTRSTGANQSMQSGGGIIDVASDNTPLVLQSFRTDPNTATQARTGNRAGIEIMRLDDDWHYLRLSKTGKQTGPTNATWKQVTYNSEDEVDTSTFTHSPGDSSIVLKSTGHYIVFANTYGGLAAGNNNVFNQKLVLNGSDVRGSLTTLYLSNTNSIFEGALSIGMIINVTVPNSVLTVQMNHTIGTTAFTIDANTSGTYVNRSAITIVKVPEGDFIRMSTSTNPVMNPSATTTVFWGLEDEKDATSFGHAANSDSIQTLVPGDYLAFATLYSSTTPTAAPDAYMMGWQKNGAGGFIPYGLSGGYVQTTTNGYNTGNWAGTIFPGMTSSDSFQLVTQSISTDVSSISAADREIEALRIASLTEADNNPQTVDSTDVTFTNGSGPRWDAINWNDTTPGSSDIKYQVVYFHIASSSYDLVPDSALSGKNPSFTNSVGTSSGPIDISGLDKNTYGILRLRATLICAAGSCPTLNDWTTTWNPGVSISGIAKLSDETTNLTSGNVAIAVNGVIQSGKNATISASGTWTLNGINAGVGDVITVWISSASGVHRAVAITKPTSTNNVAGMALYENHVTLGSYDDPTISNSDIGQYDDANNSGVFDDVDASGNLTVCPSGSDCFNSKLFVMASTTYRPSNGSAVTVNTRNFETDGTTIGDGNTFNISGSYKNTYVFTKGTSQVNFTATSTSETIDSTGATTSAAFFNVAFGSGSGSAKWILTTPLAASGTMAINFGTVAPNSTSALSLSGDLTIGSNGIFAKNATTTFSGTTETWTDNSSGQDMGIVIIGGASTTVQLGSNVKATNLTIAAGSMLDAGTGNYNFNLLSNWANNGIFSPRQGTVTFLATSTGKTIAPGISSFYNMTFNGANGNWSFTSPTTTALNNFTIATGTVTLPTGTTTVGGSWDTFGGSFQHNNSTVLFSATASGKTIHVATSTAFYDLTFNGTGGGWSFIDQNATSSRTVLIQAGTLTMPSGTFSIGGTLTNSGAITANGGTLKFIGASANSITLGGSNAFNLTFSGIGPFTFKDVNATSTGNVRFEQGTTTLPSGSLGVGASFLDPASPSGGFSNNNGIVRFVGTSGSNSITPGISKFYNLIFNGSGGSWTITQNATSTNNTTFTNANSITQTSGTTLEVDGIFTNALANASSTWTGSTLFLNSGFEYPMNAKGNGSRATFAQLTLGANTRVEAWNSSAASVTTISSGGFYSQNNANINGNLNIYGTFATSSPVSWAYQMDFDNTSLAVGRQVQVRIASSSIISLSGSTTIQGIPSATTTVQSQGTGFFNFNIVGGTTTAKYYSFGSTTPNGVQIFGANTVIASLDNGAYELDTPAGGTSISVGSEVIDNNPQIQILYTKFSTTTGIVSGFNVTATSAPQSSVNYWWFKNGYGNLYGEAYDNDIGGSPGYIQFDDSGITATISGHIYSDHGTTPMGNSVCQTGTTTAKVFIHTSSNLTYSGTCDNSGAYSITATFVPTAVLTLYLNTDGGPHAVTITKNVTGAVSNLDLYQNAIVIRQFDASPTTITDMSFVDSTFDSDIPFTATSSLMVQPGNELYIWTGKIFAPGGDVTLQGGGFSDPRDGRLYIATSSSFVESGSQNLAIGGGLQLDSGAAFTPASSTITFTATATGKSIYATRPLSLYDVVFNGAGGGWNFTGTSSATTTMHTLTPIAGTVGGTGDIDVQSGNLTGSGTIAMTGGTFLYEPSGNFGNSNAWSFNNLTFGTSTANTISKTGTATTTIAGVFTIASNMTLNAGTSQTAAWVLSSGGTPFVINGTFNVQSAPFWYTSNSATNIAGTNYGPLVLSPTGAGSPTYTFASVPTGSYTIGTTTIGDGTHAVTVTANTFDPALDFTRDLTINANATFIASDIIDTNIEGSWSNSGTFTPNGRAVIFDATTIGKTISAGSSPFAKLQFNSSTGGWTIAANATSTSDTMLGSAQSFTLASGKSLEVDGAFTNSAASSSQTWTGSLLYLNSGTSYTINSKSSGNAGYGTISIGANTNIRDWNSQQANTVTAATASLYAMNYASSSGALNIYGAYTRSSGSDFWDYATDFDGVSLGATSRKVNVSIASSSVLVFSGGLLDIIGNTTASTTIQNQGNGAYSWNVSGGTINAQYYEVRNTDANGLNLSGYPVVSGLNNGDFLLGVTGGSSITVNGTVIVSNPLKVFRNDKFATSSGVVNGFNVTPVAATSSFWKFTAHYGAFAGESYDNDPDPGFIHWDDSNDKITVSGTVYTDDGVTKEGNRLCDGVTQVLKLKIAGVGSTTASCAAANGSFTFSNVAYNPGDVLTLYIASSSLRSATVTRGETANINNMDIYEHRVIVRHEDLIPITIADIDAFDSGQDSMVPFLATVGGTNTLVIEPNTKLVVWAGKTFAPAGNVTVSSGGVNSWDGTIELQPNSIFSAAGTQSHSFGGSFLIDSGATFSAANSTVTFTATTTGKTITPQSSTFYNVTFNGSGGNWAFSAAATSTNDFTISAGTVTLPTSVLEVGGSFNNTGGAFQHNNGTVKLTSTAATAKTIQVNNNPFYNLTANGTGGSWNFIDGSATTSNDLTITAGTFKAPSSTLAVGGSFLNSGTFTANNGTVKMTSNVGGKSVLASGSNFYNLLFSGVGGGWTFQDLNATTSRDFIMSTGTVTMASGTMAVGGNFNSASTTFINNNGIVKFTATTTGFNINVGTSTFYQLVFDSATGGWTIGSNATSTATTSINNAASLTLSSGKSLEADGTFNNFAASATTWTGSTLYLNSGTAYSINNRGSTGTTYGQLTLGTNTQVRDWNSSAVNTTIGSSAYLYSQNDSNVSGRLVIYGTYTRTSGTDFWSANKDFDGTDISGSPRQVSVRIATSSSVTYNGGSLGIVGTSTATTTITSSGTNNYSFSIAGGSTTMQYYQFKNMDQNGIQLSGTPIVNTLSNGDFEMSVASGTIITVASTVINANANLTFSTDRFATTSANLRGFNVMYTGSTAGSNFWLFTGAYGNFAGEAYDSDGTNACGHILWDDSICLQISESHYRFRNDDSGEGAATSTWYNNSWSAREKIVINNPNATAYTNLPVKILLPYKSSMKSTFDDIRFTDSSGTTTIPFWRESTISSGTSTVWVKISSLPASGSATVYVYYGNSGASGADDSASTFPFIDTFDDGDISDYSGSDLPLFAANASFSYGNGSFGLSASAGNTSGKTINGGIFKTAGTPTGQGKTIRYFQYVANGGQDEPCTLFGVQAAKQNYGVCLEQFPTTNRRISLAKNIAFNDNGDTASVMASTSVTYSTTGWYEVIIDWLTGGTINVHVNDPNGNAFASLSTTSSTYSSGGMGFAYFFQSQGWDDYMVKPYTATTPTYIIGPEQSNNGASWKAAEDTKANIIEGQNTRLRFNIQNTGSAFTFGFRLQYAPKGASLSCEAVDDVNYNDVPAFGSPSCASSDICMASSTQVTTYSSTTPSLTYPASFGFTPGEIVQDPYNQSIQYFIPKNYATEVEYTFQVNSRAQQPAYCFRVWNTQNSSDLDVYNHVAEGDVLYPPFISNFQLNNSQDIVLTEGTTTTVYASSTVTDYNGYADILSATSSIYLSTLSPNCASDPIDCYQISTSSCALSNCAGNSCSLMCSASIQYFAQPTDASSTNYATTSANWLATMAVTDSTGLKDTETAIGQELDSLAGLEVNEGNIAFATTTPNSDTGRTVATTTVRNTGNIPISVDLAGQNLTDGGTNSINVTNEKVSSSTFQYATCSLCQNLQGATAVNVNVNIAQQTSTATSSQNQTNLYWGIAIPNGTYATSYAGSNTFIAVPP